MKKIKLFLDFDNTLVNTNWRCIDILNEKYKTSYTIEDLHKYDFTDLWPCLSRKDIKELFETDELFKRIEYLENCEEILYGIRNCIEPHIVSCGSKENAKRKYQWIKEHNRIFDKVTVINNDNSDKSCIDMSDGIFIDDHIDCLRSSNAKIKILYKFYSDGDWNKYDNMDEIYVVNTWKEIQSMLNFFIKNGGIEK